MDRGESLPISKPISLSEQKTKNLRRRGELLDFAKNATPEEVATALLLRERRSEEREKRKQFSKKFQIQNVDAYESDTGDILTKLFPTETSFSEKKESLNNLHLIRFDLKMLNYFNAVGGHEAGDQYKKEAANIISGKTDEMKKWLSETNTNYKSYLVGGDEFAVVTSVTPEKAEEIKNKLQAELAKMPRYPGSEIDGWVDAGIANLGEVIDVFNKFEEKYKGPDGLKGKHSRLWKLLDGLADRRADIAKFIERINFLGGLIKNHADFQSFEKLYAFATKGAFQIGRSQLEYLISAPNPDQTIKDWVKSVFTERDEFALKRIDDPFQRMATSFYTDMTRSY